MYRSLKSDLRANGCALSLLVSLGIAMSGCAVEPGQPDASGAYDAGSAAPPQVAAPSADQLDQLVAPIALYPDQLVAQILTAATYPAQIVEADRWVQANSSLKGDALAQAVDAQPWDPSVKAVAQFAPVLGMMDKNLSWTSSLGEAYVNNQAAVMDAVQVLRQRAQQAGNLKSTPQEVVQNQQQSIEIEPADPQVIYVPQYDPWLVYGAPIGLYPDWFGYPGLFVGGPGIAFGLGFGVGFFGGFGWGWGHWGANWGGHGVYYNHVPYHAHGPAFGGPGGHGFAGGVPGHHLPGVPGNRSMGMRSGAFSGFSHGGSARGFSARGRASFGGGGHGGGGHR